MLFYQQLCCFVLSIEIQTFVDTNIPFEEAALLCQWIRENKGGESSSTPRYDVSLIQIVNHIRVVSGIPRFGAIQKIVTGKRHDTTLTRYR
jgi:hypothetical protein